MLMFPILVEERGWCVFAMFSVFSTVSKRVLCCAEDSQ